MENVSASVNALMEMAKQANSFFDHDLTDAFFLLPGKDEAWKRCSRQHRQMVKKLRGLVKMATLCGVTTTLLIGEKDVDEDEGESLQGYIYAIWQDGTRYWLDGRVEEDADSQIDGELNACRWLANGKKSLFDTVKFDIWDF